MEEEKMAANIAVRAALDGITEIMGENGCKMIFKNAELAHIYENPPAYDWNPCITISQQGRLYPEIANLLGLKGALGVWRRVGFTNIKYAVEMGHILDNITDPDPKEKFNTVMGIYLMGIGVGRLVTNTEGVIDYDVFDCPVCLEYESKRSVCTVITGSIQYIANWAYGEGEKIAKEIKCKAKGDDTCYFVIEDKD